MEYILAGKDRVSFLIAAYKLSLWWIAYLLLKKIKANFRRDTRRISRMHLHLANKPIVFSKSLGSGLSSEVHLH